MKRFEGKTILVTGASAGIGRATLLAFANEGAIVINADISEKLGQEVIDEIQENGGQGVFVKTDVSKHDQVKKLIEIIIEKNGRLDIAFNNAGVEEPQMCKLADISEKSGG